MMRHSQLLNLLSQTLCDVFFNNIPISLINYLSPLPTLFSFPTLSLYFFVTLTQTLSYFSLLSSYHQSLYYPWPGERHARRNIRGIERRSVETVLENTADHETAYWYDIYLCVNLSVLLHVFSSRISTIQFLPKSQNSITQLLFCFSIQSTCFRWSSLFRSRILWEATILRFWVSGEIYRCRGRGRGRGCRDRGR